MEIVKRTLMLLGWLAIHAIAQAEQPQVTPLPESVWHDGCGCRFERLRPHAASQPATDTILEWDTEGQGGIMLDGLLVPLQQSGAPADSMGTAESLGARQVFRLHGRGTKVEAQCRVSQICAPDDDSCEVIQYRGRIVVRTKSGATVVQVSGMCGC